MSDPSMILGEWAMRRGDRLPMLSLVVEDDQGRPADLTGGTAYLILRHEEALPVTDVPVGALGNGAIALPTLIYDAPNGIVIYDWPQAETSGLTVGALDLSVVVTWPDGRSLTAPSARQARLVVRPSALPSG